MVHKIAIPWKKKTPHHVLAKLVRVPFHRGSAQPSAANGLRTRRNRCHQQRRIVKISSAQGAQRSRRKPAVRISVIKLYGFFHHSYLITELPGEQRPPDQATPTLLALVPRLTRTFRHNLLRFPAGRKETLSNQRSNRIGWCAGQSDWWAINRRQSISKGYLGEANARRIKRDGPASDHDAGGGGRGNTLPNMLSRVGGRAGRMQSRSAIIPAASDFPTRAIARHSTTRCFLAGFSTGS